MRILVSGATGFIGSYLARQLQTEHEVYALVQRYPPRYPPANLHWIEQDLTEPLDYSRLPHRVDALIHLAQSEFYKQFPGKAEHIFAVNIHGTFRLLEYARQAGAERFVFASSGGVYGSGNTRLVETDPVDPTDFYLRSKYAAEQLIASYRTFFHTVILRPFFVYGPGQQQMIVPNLARRIERGETITIEGNPGIRINPTYVEDAARAFEAALWLDGSELINVAGDEAVTITDLVALIAELMDKPVVVHHTADQQIRDLVADNTKMKEILRVQPSTWLRRGLGSYLASVTTVKG